MRRPARRSRTTDGAVLGHLGVNVPDLERASAYYGPLMPLLGYEPFFTTEDALAFMPAGGRGGLPVLVRGDGGPGLHDARRTGLQHLAFIVPTRGAVRGVHAHVSGPAARSCTHHRSGRSIPPPYFATFWLDPFGLMLEAVCHHDRD